MTVKEASENFGLSKDLIRKLCRESQKGDIKYIQSVKLNGKWVLNDPDIILTKSQIQNILLQIIRFKNNPNSAISRRCFPTDDILKTAIKDLCRLGFVTECDGENYRELFGTVMITEEGITYLVDKKSEQTITNAPAINIFNFEAKAGAVVI